jgi:hypothetical protein
MLMVYIFCICMLYFHRTVYIKQHKPDMVAHDYNPSTWVIEAGGVRVQGQSGLHSAQKFKKKKPSKQIAIT